MQIARAYSFSGPLPPPEALEKYNQVLPGAAERILMMAEQQGKHRQLIEKRVIDSNAFTQKMGPVLGFIVAMTAVLGGIYLVHSGQSTAGLVSILVPLATLSGIFIYGKSEQRKELQAKAQDFARPLAR